MTPWALEIEMLTQGRPDRLGVGGLEGRLDVGDVPEQQRILSGLFPAPTALLAPQLSQLLDQGSFDERVLARRVPQGYRLIDRGQDILAQAERRLLCSRWH